MKHEYTGYFKNWLKHGRGKYTMEVGSWIEGVWENDDLISGDVYENNSLLTQYKREEVN